MTLLNSSFRPHSHTGPPNLAPFLGSLTHLTFANVGLPSPSSHLTAILRICAPSLQYLAISSLRDIDAAEFRTAFEILVERGHRLETVLVGFLTEPQISVLHNSDSGSRPDDPPRALLSRLPALRHLTWTLPLPTLPLLLALPPTLETLTIRPPYSRPSTMTREHSRASLLSILARTPGEHTPSTPLSAAIASPGNGVRHVSVTLEQLEEEEAVVLALEEALERGAAGERLSEVRWECRALRSARGRIEAAMERRHARASWPQWEVRP